MDYYQPFMMIDNWLLPYSYRIPSTPQRTVNWLAQTGIRYFTVPILQIRQIQRTCSSATMLLHIFRIHRPNFEENGRIFEVAMNRNLFT